MRALGWGIVVILLAVGGFFLFASYLADIQLQSADMKKYAQSLSSPLVQRYRPDLVEAGIAHIRGQQQAVTFSMFLGLGAGALGIISAVIMAATSSRRDRHRTWECVSCGAGIRSGTLCGDCRV